MFTMLNAGAGILGVLAVFGGLLFIAVIGAIVLQVLYSFGMYKMGQRAGVENSWLAFIPPLNFYVMGKLFDRNGGLRILGNDIPSPEIVLPLVPVVMWVGSAIFAGKLALISSLITLAGGIFIILCNYELFKLYKGDKATSTLILCIFVPFALPIVIFNLRNADPIGGGYSDYNGGYYDNNDHYGGYY